MTSEIIDYVSFYVSYSMKIESTELHDSLQVAVMSIRRNIVSMSCFSDGLLN